MPSPDGLETPQPGDRLSAADYALIQELVKQALKNTSGEGFTDSDGAHTRVEDTGGSAQLVVIDEADNRDSTSESAWVRGISKSDTEPWDGRWKTDGDSFEVLCWPTALQEDYHVLRQLPGFLDEETQVQRIQDYDGEQILDPPMTKDGLMELNFNDRIRASDCQIFRE